MPANTALQPPLAPKKQCQISLHGKTLQDDYFWFRERENQEVIAYLKAENAYTEAVLAPLKPLQKQLFSEMRARIKETDFSVPVAVGPYFYYSRTEQDRQYPIFARKKDSLAAPEELLLDLNRLAGGGRYLALGVLKASPDHRYLAYSLDFDGSEEHVLYVKDLETGRLLEEKIQKTAGSLEWAEDSGLFFYVTLDPAKRPYRLWRHQLGKRPEEDVLLYTESDESFGVAIRKTRDREFFILETGSSTASECRVFSAKDPLGAMSLVQPREKGVEYYLDHHDRFFYILTNDQAVNFRVMRAGDHDPQKPAWKEYIPHRPEVKLEKIDCFEQYFMIEEREQGLVRLRVMRPATGEQHTITLPETVYSVWSGNNPEFKARIFRLNYTSLITPVSVYDYHVQERRLELRKQTEVVGGYDASRYQTERIFTRSPDGVEVPISLVYPRGIVKDGKAPLLLYGYGAYGISLAPEFSSNRLSLLDRGVVFALAHIRGGGDLGRPWHNDGKLLKKKNTFQDFIACAEYLNREGWTSPEKMAIAGSSAGGLLMGAVTNQRPDLFHAVVAKVPFVDLIHTMLDPSLPLTVGEYDEWGDPENPEYFDSMLSYAPYDQVKTQHYPNMLITGGFYDPRVPYWEPAKWTAKLRQHNLAKTLILLQMNMEAGHGGASGRFDYLREVALEYGFLLWQWGLA